MKLRIPDYVRDLKPYKSGNKLEGGITREEFKQMINLASNENPFGPSPKAMEAMKNSISESNIYPDPGAIELVDALAKYYNRDPKTIITGNGSDSLLQIAFNAFSCKDEEILTAEATFIGCFVNANKLGRKLTKVPNKNYAYDLDAIASAVNENTRIIYLANPNNPTGTMFAKDDFESFMDKIPNDILVILDEAYWLYSAEFEEYPDGLDYNYSNLIVMRTFSKIYGLAGIRVGFAFAQSEIIDIMYRVKLPFEPSIIAQNGAIAALDDHDYVKMTIDTNTKCLRDIENTLKELNIDFVPGKANFTMTLWESRSTAESFVKYMLQNGIVTRHLPMFGLDNAVRINSGTVDQTNKAIDLIKKFKTENN